MRFFPTLFFPDFRFILITFAALALVLGLWMTSAEIIRPHAGIDAPAAQEEFQKQRARIAARIGMVRGDLWAEAALIQSGFDIRSGAQVAKMDVSETKAVWEAAERGLAIAPLNPSLWLLLANPGSPSDAEGFNRSLALEMAYLTGQQDLRLLPARLLIAARSSALSEKTIQDFVRGDIGFVFKTAPALRPAILAAYKASSIENRPFLQRIIAAADPSFLPAAGDQTHSP